MAFVTKMFPFKVDHDTHLVFAPGEHKPTSNHSSTATPQEATALFTVQCVGAYGTNGESHAT